jgi:hypothetical protein
MWSTPRPTSRLRADGCARLGCGALPVIVVRHRVARVVITYCSGHAGAVGRDPEYEVVWLQTGWIACLVCGRALPRDMSADHFGTDGSPCRPMASAIITA